MRVLIVTSRWNSALDGVDGGSMTAYNIVDALYSKCDLDLLINERSVKDVDKNRFHSIYTYNPQPLINTSRNKFNSRYHVSRILAPIIKNLISLYDRVVIVHVYHALHLVDLLSEVEYEKIVLFPMFLSKSYNLSGIVLPAEYTERERVFLEKAGRIITPSHFEQQQLVNGYNIRPGSIRCVPRYVDDVFSNINHSIDNRKVLRFCCISSFRKQKRNHLIIPFALGLRKASIKAEIILIGSIQDDDEFEKYQALKNSHLEIDNIRMVNSMSQSDLNDLFLNMDFSISFSSCETFGRSVTESLYCGLPNIVLDDNHILSTIIGHNHGALFCDTIDNMVSEINELQMRADDYKKLSIEASSFGKRFNKTSVAPILAEAIIH